MTPGRIFTLLAIAGLAYFLFSRALRPDGSQPQPEPDQQAEALQQPEKPSPEPLAGPDAVEDPVAQEPAPTAAATASVPAAPTPRAGAANAPPSKVKPSASEAQAERVAEPKTAPEAPATLTPKQPTPTPSNEDAPPFNQGAAIGALNRAVAQASGCRQEGDPSGTARVVITFAPSGRVTSANLSGPPFAGTRTGGCIAATMRGATVPAFSGTHVTVSKSLVIR
jgi:hypothetical protein